MMPEDTREIPSASDLVEDDFFPWDCDNGLPEELDSDDEE
jgi:hypothetical protein